MIRVSKLCGGRRTREWVDGSGCLSRMRGNLHVRFLGGRDTARYPSYPTSYEGSIPFTRSNSILKGPRGPFVASEAGLP